MPRKIAFLHTSPVHIETFEQLVKAADPGVQINHVVAEDLLTDAQTVGIHDRGLVERIHKAMTDAASGGSVVVACTCSTIGGVAERALTNGRFKAMRIDRAMADRAVQCGPRILVVATAESTIQPTIALIQESADALGTEVSIQHRVGADAWSHFLRGDREAYMAAIVALIRSTPIEADVIVLAQASMAPAAQRLGDLGIEVLSSPILGVRSILDHVTRQRPTHGELS